MADEITTRDITPEEIEMLKPYTKQHTATLWGSESKTTPTLVSQVFGDGGSLISLEPTNDRPAFYVMLAPSSITSFEDALEFIADNEELIYAPIEEEYGNADDEPEPYLADEPGNLPLNIGSGYTAGYYTEFKNTLAAA